MATRVRVRRRLRLPRQREEHALTARNEDRLVDPGVHADGDFLRSSSFLVFHVASRSSPVPCSLLQRFSPCVFSKAPESVSPAAYHGSFLHLRGTSLEMPEMRIAAAFSRSLPVPCSPLQRFNPCVFSKCSSHPWRSRFPGDFRREAARSNGGAKLRAIHGDRSSQETSGERQREAMVVQNCAMKRKRAAASKQQEGSI